MDDAVPVGVIQGFGDGLDYGKDLLRRKDFPDSIRAWKRLTVHVLHDDEGQVSLADDVVDGDDIRMGQT